MAEFWQRCKLLRLHSHSNRPHLSPCSRLLASRLSLGQDHTAIPHIQSLITRPHVTTNTLDSESSDSNPKAARSSLKARARCAPHAFPCAPLRCPNAPLRFPNLPCAPCALLHVPLRSLALSCALLRFPAHPSEPLRSPARSVGRSVGLSVGLPVGLSVRLSAPLSLLFNVSLPPCLSVGRSKEREGVRRSANEREPSRSSWSIRWIIGLSARLVDSLGYWVIGRLCP